VRPLLRDQLRPRPRQDPKRDLVGHRRRRQEERRLLTEERGGALLQLVDGGILAQLLVADLGRGHRRAHLRRRSGRRVGAEIDHASD
jgi:hypothetical protein